MLCLVISNNSPLYVDFTKRALIDVSIITMDSVYVSLIDVYYHKNMVALLIAPHYCCGKGRMARPGFNNSRV